jgi:ribonucleoside-diphosphate reductase alpha chain
MLIEQKEQQTFTYEEVLTSSVEYFKGDELAAEVWRNKYALKNNEGQFLESTPRDMHIRMAKEFERINKTYSKPTKKQLDILSKFGAKFLQDPSSITVDFAMSYLDNFKYIMPQGSIMSALGNKFKIQSLSNCFVIPAPLDSYGGIFKTDQEIAQLEKRRGGVGTHLNLLRPDDTPVINAAGTSTGAHSFMPRYSNTTREVAQNGRRGALMLLMSVMHPDIFKFVSKKKDRTQVTGANVSVQVTDKFMEAAQEDLDFICKFPIDSDIDTNPEMWDALEYNVLHNCDKGQYVMKIRAKELYDLIVEMAWENAEPGVAFMDRVINYSPDGVYKQFMAIASNPCGEQWMQAYDACRLLAAMLYNLVKNPFKETACLDLELAYEIFYVQQYFADNIVDLEIEYVDNIIKKIESDPEPDDIKLTELNLWKKVKETATASRRTGCGFTALADMLAALNLKYDSPEALKATESVMKVKMQAELDCTIDLAVLRGTFEGWDKTKEFISSNHKSESIFNENGSLKNALESSFILTGGNDFYKMIIEEFPEQATRMYQFGRRNVSWSTVAPTGSLSIIAILNRYCNTSGGCEAVFMPFYFRNKKVNPSDKNSRIDFKDQNGDCWQTFPVVMGGFKEWYVVAAQCEHCPEIAEEALLRATKEEMQKIFEASPYYGACANDISWENRIKMQSILQKYTTNAISSTLNLPKDVTKETVSGIYMEAWKNGLKGVTIYRDGSRSGVLVAEKVEKTVDKFSVNHAPKRPKALEATVLRFQNNYETWIAFVGLLDGKPYEIFTGKTNRQMRIPSNVMGHILKSKNADKSGKYDFVWIEEGEECKLENIHECVDNEYYNYGKLLSGILRHGMPIPYVVDIISGLHFEEDHISTWKNGVLRALKQFIADNEKPSDTCCSSCGDPKGLIFREGCQVCQACGVSKCG